MTASLRITAVTVENLHSVVAALLSKSFHNCTELRDCESKHIFQLRDGEFRQLLAVSISRLKILLRIFPIQTESCRLLNLCACFRSDVQGDSNLCPTPIAVECRNVGWNSSSGGLSE